jgi:hypothetical protein
MAGSEPSASQLIDEKIAGLGGWRGDVLARVRKIILEADPKIIETVKWRKPTNPSGVPVWECGGIICTGETYKDKVKLTFMKGSALADPAGLFNAGEGVRRAIDIGEGGRISEKALKALVRAAVALNAEKTPKAAVKAAVKAAPKAVAKKPGKRV